MQSWGDPKENEYQSCWFNRRFKFDRRSSSSVDHDGPCETRRQNSDHATDQFFRTHPTDNTTLIPKPISSRVRDLGTQVHARVPYHIQECRGDDSGTKSLNPATQTLTEQGHDFRNMLAVAPFGAMQQASLCTQMLRDGTYK